MGHRARAADPRGGPSLAVVALAAVARMKPTFRTGLYDQMPMSTYLADPCQEPSLSASILHALVNQSPWHAWAAHPRLGNCAPREESERLDLGTIAHAYLLEGITAFEVLPEEFTDFRKKAAQEYRDAARLAGKLPVLASKWTNVLGMVTAARAQLDAIEPGALTPEGGRSEETLIWQEGGLWCRARLDWLAGNHRDIWDYKTTGATANPEVVSRTLFANGWDIKAAWYLRGVRHVLGTPAPTFRFAVQEDYAPHAMSVLALSPAALELAERKVEHGLALWRGCLDAGAWPGYPQQTCYADVPPWELARWERLTPPLAAVDEGAALDELFGDAGR